MPLNREQVVQTAEKYVSRGKIEAAIREYRKVLAENPGDANTLNRVGDLYARIQRIDEAVDFFTQIAAKYTQEGFFVKAIAIYKKIIKLDPTRLEVYEQLAELYHKQGLVNEARTQYQVLADYYLKHENPTSAIAIYQKMTELEPDNPTYHVKLAELYGQQRLTEKALTEHRIIAELMLAHGHAEEAEQVYERGLDIDPANTAFITDAVLKLREAGHAAAASRLLEVAIERNPQAERIARLVVGVEDAPGTPGSGSGVFAAPPYDEVAAGEPDGLDELGFTRQELAGREGHEPPQRAEERADGPGLAPPSQVELLAALEEVEAATLSPAAGAAPAEAPIAPLEFDLDLDDVFVLDMEDEDEPASLVKPPPDMLGDEPRRPAWAQQPATAPAGGPAPAAPKSRAMPPMEAAGAAAPEPFPSHGEAPPPLAGPPGWREAVEAAARAVDLPESAGLAPAAEVGPAGAAADLGNLGDVGDIAFADLGDLAELPEAAGLLDGLGEAPAALPALDAEEIELEAEPFDLDSYEPAPAEPAPGLAAGPFIEGQAEPPVAPTAATPAPAAPVPPAAMPPVSASPVPPPAAAPPRIDPDLLERTAAKLHPQPVHREEDLVTEAEVLAKYGLEEKAMERLREALRLNPRHLEAYGLIAQLHLDKGRHPRVVAVANQMSDAAARVANREPWLKLRKRLAAAGYGLDGDRVVSPPQARPVDDGVNALMRGLLDVPGAKPAGRRSAGPSRPSEGIAAPPVGPPVDISRLPGEGASATPPPGPVAAPPALSPAAAAASPAFEAPPDHREPAAPPAPASPPPATAAEGPASPGAVFGVPASPGLGSGAPASPGAVSGAPASPGLGRMQPPAAPFRFNPLEIGEMVDREDVDADSPVLPVAVPPPSPPREPAAPAAGRESLDDTSMSWLDEVEAGRARQAGDGGGRRGGGLFADEEDFFDLAAELEQELSREDGGTADLLAQPAEQSLEQIVEGFKKGVAENLSPTDYDTHLNLGIAYREMGLLDEAIGEFQLASKDPRLLVECCAMLGLCFLDKGLPELAIKWYRRGLESPRASEEESLGLMYDMGNVYEAMADIESAYKTFVDIYGINTNFRDVVARIEELGRAR